MVVTSLNEEDDHYPKLQGWVHNVHILYVYGTIQRIDPYIFN
jgi:hypothetical protein